MNKTRLYAPLFLFSLFVLAVVTLSVVYGPVVVRLARDPQHFLATLNQYGSCNVLIFIGLQIGAIILAPIPSDLLFIAGGFMYGAVLGTVYSMIGVLIGSTLVLFIAKFFGFQLIRAFLPRRHFDRFAELLKGSRAKTAVFLLYLLPDLPKDILTYLAGLSPLEPLNFLLLSNAARLPCVIGSSFIGANLHHRNPWFIAVMLGIAGCLVLGGLLFRGRIIKALVAVIPVAKDP